MGELVEKKQDIAAVRVPSYADIADRYPEALNPEALKKIDDIILKRYITELDKMEVIPLSTSTPQFDIKDNVHFFKITEMVYEKNEFAVYKFDSVFNALAIADSSIFIIIDSDGKKTDFYMGVRSLDKDRTISSLRDMLKNAMKGQFPGIKISDDYMIKDMENILDHIKVKNISAVSCVGNSKLQENHTNQNFVQGLEKLVLSMQGEKYTGIIIADSASQSQLRELRKQFETIYTQLSGFASSQVNYTSNKAFNYSVAENRGSSQAQTHTDNCSETKGESRTSGSSSSHSVSRENGISRVLKGVSSAAMLLALPVSLPAALPAVTLTVGEGLLAAGIGGMLSSALGKTETDSTSHNESLAQSFSVVNGSSDGTTNTVSYGVSKTEGHTKGVSEGLIRTFHNKSIEDMLERINKQLKRIDEFESFGMYGCAAYFLSDDLCAAEAAASMYKALMRGENSGIETAAINSWGNEQENTTEMIGQYVKHFVHPVFKDEERNMEITPASFVSGKELSIHMGLPRHSVCGLPVIEHADFGKEVVSYDGIVKASSGIKLGSIFNMGSECSSKVFLDAESLSMHTFITGATGSGKSNAVYEIVRQLRNLGINYLIVEPAKGEYKNVFGTDPDVSVYGTNPQYTELLRINPFKFPQGIHVLEHIDRLIEIFNVCWPMYAAMPAVLKSAVLRAYESCGWDLSASENRYSPDLFPTFADVLSELEKVIQASAYSEEVKSNYTGSLVTRVQSLTNGLNGLIFTANEIESSTLFDEKVIVDISRVGSAETKSLIMGILIMRLSEYRMSSGIGMNAALRHVTVLEEAHNILKRTSVEQTEESANVFGKAVEMISNAIAEMRTYGEGFIIADQSPNAVDISAIRNTNTKIIMRLPDEQDRRLAGKAAGLKDDQLDEIAKLPKGVGVVYQNDWVEPVLCKIEKFKGTEKIYKKPFNTAFKSNSRQKEELLRSLINKSTGEYLDMTIGELTDMLIGMDIPTKAKVKALRALRSNGSCAVNDISSVVYDLVCTPAVEKEAEAAESIEEWENGFLYANDSVLARLDLKAQNIAIECILREQIERYNKPDEYLTKWQEYRKGELL